LSPEPLEPDRREEVVEEVAREIALRGLAGPAVQFLHASRPYRPLGTSAMLFFDPVLRQVFGGGHEGASALLADDESIEQLIDRLEELADEVGWEV
jgi:hypothetical protein